MSVTKDGFYNIEGKMFEVVHGVEGDCLILGDEDGGTRISGPKPWGGGQVTKTFVTQEKYGPIERLEEENVKLRELCEELYEDLDGLIGNDTLVVDRGRSRWLLDKNDVNRYRVCMRELGIEVEDV